MRLDFSSVQPVIPTRPGVSEWDHLGHIVGPPPSPVQPPAYPPAETVLSAESLRNMLIELGAAATPSNLALAESLAKLGVPLTEANILEGQTLLKRMPGISPSVYALSKALDLPPSMAILKALTEVADRETTPNHLDLGTLDILSLLPRPGRDPIALSGMLAGLFQKLGQSTENRLLNDPEIGNTLSVYDSRTSLLELAGTVGGGSIAQAADRHASYIEGQQLLNQASVQKFDSTVPMYFAFPIAFAAREASCEVQVWAGKEQRSHDALGADQEEYLRAIVRINGDRLGAVETSLVGMWSGRLVVTLYVARPLAYRLLRREAPALSLALSSIGWNVAPIDVVKRDHFAPLWLGGDLLENPRARVDKRI